MNVKMATLKMEHRAGQQTGQRSQGELDQGRTGEGWEDGDKVAEVKAVLMSGTSP